MPIGRVPAGCMPVLVANPPPGVPQQQQQQPGYTCIPASFPTSAFAAGGSGRPRCSPSRRPAPSTVPVPARVVDAPPPPGTAGEAPPSSSPPPQQASLSALESSLEDTRQQRRAMEEYARTVLATAAPPPKTAPPLRDAWAQTEPVDVNPIPLLPPPPPTMGTRQLLHGAVQTPRAYPTEDVSVDRLKEMLSAMLGELPVYSGPRTSALRATVMQVADELAAARRQLHSRDLAVAALQAEVAAKNVRIGYLQDAVYGAGGGAGRGRGSSTPPPPSTPPSVVRGEAVLPPRDSGGSVDGDDEDAEQPELLRSSGEESPPPAQRAAAASL